MVISRAGNLSVVTTLAAGFVLAVHPISAQVINGITKTWWLVVVKIL